MRSGEVYKEGRGFGPFQGVPSVQGVVPWSLGETPKKGSADVMDSSGAIFHQEVVWLDLPPLSVHN